MKKINVCGTDVFVTKKRIKNIYLRVKNTGEVFVSAPLFTSDDLIIDFVNSKAEWINKTKDRMLDKGAYQAAFLEGEERSFLGSKYTMHIDTERNGGYYFNGNDIVICVGKYSTIESRKKALAEVYRDALEEIMPELAKKCQQKANLYAREWRIRDMKTRWGSCNTKERRIWLSVWLMEQPLEFIEAVVFHELTHLKIKGHNKEFYKLLESYCPNYREIEKRVKRKNLQK